MKQAECVEFLQWCLPQLRLRWLGFRRVRSQVCKRIARRMHELGLDSVAAYRSHLASHSEEWAVLDSMCRITISRFYRDRAVFEALETIVLPTLAAAASERGDRTLRAWSCGCASGEEPYTLAIVWSGRVASRIPGMNLEITATDADPRLLERARSGIFTAGCLRELPEDLRRASFQAVGERFRIHDRIRQQVTLRRQDVRVEAPAGPFDLILCRNLVLTYYDEPLQSEVMDRVLTMLRPGGALVIGSHERLPKLDPRCEPWSETLPIARRVG